MKSRAVFIFKNKRTEIFYSIREKGIATVVVERGYLAGLGSDEDDMGILGE